MSKHKKRRGSAAAKVYRRIQRGATIITCLALSLALINVLAPLLYPQVMGYKVFTQYIAVLLYLLSYLKGMGIMKQSVPIVEFFLLRVIQSCWYIFVSEHIINWVVFIILCALDVILLSYMTYDKMKIEYVKE